MAEGAEDSSSHDNARRELEGYLNKRMRIGLSDGRVIDGMFLCTDKDCNIVLGNCEEFLSQDEVEEYERRSSENTAKFFKQPRTLSLAIVPGEHVLSIALAMDQQVATTTMATPPSPSDSSDTATDVT